MQTDQHPQLHHIAGSIVAGCLSTLVGHPLDTLKVLQQSQKSISWNRKFLFQGIGPPMINQILMNTVMFTVFHNVKDYSNTVSVLFGGEKHETIAAVTAGLLSGFAIATLSTPLDWIKIQAQLQQVSSNKKYDKRNGMSILQNLLRENQYNAVKTMRTLYRGHVPNLAREGVFTMVYLGMYDRICSFVLSHSDQEAPLHMSNIVMISAFTGACAWICNYPFDTLKTVMQGKSKHLKREEVGTALNMKAAFQKIWRSGGVRALYRGVQASTFRAMLVTSIRMVAYEKTMQALRYE